MTSSVQEVKKKKVRHSDARKRSVTYPGRAARSVRIGAWKMYHARLLQTHVLWKWTVRHTGFHYSRFARRTCGRAVLPMALLRSYIGVLIPGTSVSWKRSLGLSEMGGDNVRMTSRDVLDCVRGRVMMFWSMGHTSSLNDDDLLMSGWGHMRCRTVVRLMSDRWSQYELMENVCGLPWNDEKDFDGTNSQNFFR